MSMMLLSKFVGLRLKIISSSGRFLKQGFLWQFVNETSILIDLDNIAIFCEWNINPTES